MTVTPTDPRTTHPADLPGLDELVARTSALLADGVPLTLLLDLACGPHSEELWADEAPELAWLRPRTASDALRDAG